MFAIGNNELASLQPVGKTAKCPKCQKKHKIKYATNIKTGKASDLGVVNCGKESYLVAVAGKLLKS